MCLWAWWHKAPRLYSGFIDCWLLLEFWPNKNCLHSELDILWHLFRKLLHSSLIEFWNSFLSKTKTLIWNLFCAKNLQHLFCTLQNLIFLLKILLYPAANKMFLFVNICVWTNIIVSAVIKNYLISFFSILYLSFSISVWLSNLEFFSVQNKYLNLKTLIRQQLWNLFCKRTHFISLFFCKNFSSYSTANKMLDIIKCFCVDVKMLDIIKCFCVDL